jgi:hypothetical protein
MSWVVLANDTAMYDLTSGIEGLRALKNCIPSDLCFLFSAPHEM